MHVVWSPVCTSHWPDVGPTEEGECTRLHERRRQASHESHNYVDLETGWQNLSQSCCGGIENGLMLIRPKCECIEYVTYVEM
jgi:hypothetical protein